VEKPRKLEEVVAPPPPSSGLVIPVVMLASITLGVFAYALRERHQAAQRAADAARLTDANNRLTWRLNQTQSQLDALEAKLNAMSVLLSQPRSPSPPVPPAANRPAGGEAVGWRTDQSRQWVRIEQRLAAQQKAIASTERNLEEARTDLEGKLSSARGELNGSIARTHEEVVGLEEKGERDYYEFHLAKSKQFQRVGPLSLSLRKTSAKHEYYDVAMVVDDRELNKKHVNLYEALLIYPAASHPPVEIVVYNISKDEVRGYVSAPKYTGSRNVASGASAGTESAPTPSGDGFKSIAGERPSPTQVSLSHRPSPQPVAH
jgi:hypothetical protein